MYQQKPVYDIERLFQKELALLERKKTESLTAEQLSELTADQRLLLAKTEFLDIQREHKLTAADVLSFFPEEESVAFLQSLMK